MKIVRIDSALVRVPFTEVIAWGSGTRIGTTRLVCRIETDDGHVGWGETLCLIDAVPAVFDAVVAPIGMGMAVCDAERLHRHVLGAGYYHHKRAAVMAIAALEMAMWDAFGHIAGQPLHALWGGAWRRRVEAAAYTFTRDPIRLAEVLGAFRDAGHTTFKVKIGFDPESDVALAEAARAAIGDAELRLDVNGAWTRGGPNGSSGALRSSIPPMSNSPWNSTTSPAMRRFAPANPSRSRSTRAHTRWRTWATS